LTRGREGALAGKLGIKTWRGKKEYGICDQGKELKQAKKRR